MEREKNYSYKRVQKERKSNKKLQKEQ